MIKIGTLMVKQVASILTVPSMVEHEESMAIEKVQEVEITEALDDEFTQFNDPYTPMFNPLNENVSSLAQLRYVSFTTMPADGVS